MTAKNLPMQLTVARLIAAPVTAGLVLWADASILTAGAGRGAFIYAGALTLFAVAALTDAADGILARKLGVTSPLGAALDHAADKALTCCVLVALAATVMSTTLIVAAILLIGRDVVIGGLREGLSLSGRPLPVAQAGKIKTALILVGIGAILLEQALLLANAAPQLAFVALDWFVALSLWSAVALSFWSGWAYVQAALKPVQ
jgi:cardiolipin synthase (CMP-forming)